MPSARGGRDTRAERVSGALASAQGDELHHEMGVSSHVYLGITEHAKILLWNTVMSFPLPGCLVPGGGGIPAHSGYQEPLHRAGGELHHEMGVSSHVYLGITEHALAPVREGEGAVGDRVPS